MPANPVRSGRLAIVVATIGGVVFVGSLLYFLWSYGWRFDAAVTAGTGAAIGLDLALFSIFAMHHSVFARTGVKAWIARRVPAPLERSTYVWIASVLFLVTCGAWVAVPGLVWRAEGTLRWGLILVQAAAVVFTVDSARRLGLLHLAGLSQVLRADASASAPAELDQSGPYALVRHPIYFGWLLIVWPAPTMNGTRLVFAIVSTLYLGARRAVRRTRPATTVRPRLRRLRAPCEMADRAGAVLTLRSGAGTGCEPRARRAARRPEAHGRAGPQP